MTNASTSDEPKPRRPRGKPGTGNVRKRGATWYAAWSTVEDGKRVQNSKGGFSSQKEAQAHIGSQLAKVKDGSYRRRTTVRWTVTDLMEAWIAERELFGLKASTIAGYRITTKAWITPKIGHLPVESLTVSRLNQWLGDLGRTGSKSGGPLSARSVRMSATMLQMASKWAVGTNQLRVNVAAQATMPKRQEKKMTIWQRDDTAKFAASVATDRLGALYLLGLTRGMRRGELCGLRWENVDLVAGHLNVVETRIIVGGVDIQTSTPKTDAGKRRVPLDDKLVAILTAHRIAQKADRLAYAGAWTDSGYAFTMEDGLPVKPDHISDKFKRLCRKADVPVIRLHDMRHGVASHMLDAGAPVTVVADLLGHSDPEITMRIYAHSVNGAVDKAGQALSDAFGL